MTTRHAETGRPVPPAELPEGVTCALTTNGHLDHEERWQIDRFQRFLTEKAAINAEYADSLGPITPVAATAALRPIPAGHADDPQLVRLWQERARRLRTLFREYDAETQPESDEAKRELLADASAYLAVIHRHANRHDVLGANLTCAGCALLDRIEAAESARQHAAADAIQDGGAS